MLESKINYFLENKGINNVISKKDGKEYNLKTLYLKDLNGLLYQVVVNDNLYNKAEVGKTYKLKVVMAYNGKFSINDLELIK